MTALPTDPSVKNQQVAVRGVIAALSNEYADRVDAATVARVVDDVVTELQTRAKVRLYIPVLAQREARRRLTALVHQDGPPSAAA
jgi:hypothetical protein